MNKKTKLGQFFTTNSEYILSGLTDFIPKDVEIVDPFAGDCDLIKLFNNKSYAFDIDPANENVHYNDSLNNPLTELYKNKWIITNPPYLAKNKNSDKSIYKKYNTDDLYKASIISIDGCEGGILILPLNFFTSKDSKIREYFFYRYTILSKVKIFETQVFEDTTSSVCCFAFGKLEKPHFGVLNIEFEFINEASSEVKCFELNKKYGYKIGGDIYETNNRKDVIVSRLLEGQNPNTCINLYALDNKDNTTNNNRIRLVYENKPIYGKQTDRMFATITTNINLTEKQQKNICKIFNGLLEGYREQYRSLFLSSYREFTRKRITFSLAYDMIKDIIIAMEDTGLLKI